MEDVEEERLEALGASPWADLCLGVEAGLPVRRIVIVVVVGRRA